MGSGMVSGTGCEAPLLLPVSGDGVLPLSFAQQRLWFLDQLASEKAVYNIPLMLRLRGELDEERLRRSFDHLMVRHEVLRTTFPNEQDIPVQRVWPAGGFELRVTDLSERPAGERQIEAEELAKAEVRRGFDLVNGPVVRGCLLRMSGEEHLLVVTIHHIAGDGWSMGVLVDEVLEVYRSLGEGVEPKLGELAVQYGDYAVWQREWLKGERLERQLAYWKERLAGAPAVLEMPTDRPRPLEESYRGGRESVRLSGATREALAGLCRGQDVTLFMVLMAGFEILLERYSGQEDMVVGTAIAGRNRAEIEGLIGFFVNALVIRTDLSGDPSVQEVLSRVREATLGAYDHQEVPFEMLVEELEPARSLAYAPVFQAMLVLQNAPGSTVRVPGLEVTVAEAPHTGTSKFDLVLSVEEGLAGIRCTLEYNSDLYEGSTIRRMLGHYERLLEGMAASPEIAIGRLGMLTAGERRQLVEEWNDTGRADQAGRCVHELFERAGRANARCRGRGIQR